jgi:hypothetical protein
MNWKASSKHSFFSFIPFSISSILSKFKKAYSTIVFNSGCPLMFLNFSSVYPPSQERKFDPLITADSCSEELCGGFRFRMVCINTTKFISTEFSPKISLQSVSTESLSCLGCTFTILFLTILGFCFLNNLK